MQSLVSILLFFIVVIPVFVAIIFTYQIRNRPKTLEMGSIGLFLMDILMWGMGTLGCGGCFYLLSHIDYSIQISQYCLSIVVISFLNFCFLGGRKRFRKENWHFYFFAILFFLTMVVTVMILKYQLKDARIYLWYLSTLFIFLAMVGTRK
jgi:membrane protein